MASVNRFSSYIRKIKQSPKFLHTFLLSKLFCSQVKFAGTAGVKIHDVTRECAHLSLANKKRVQNHIGGVHAIAAGLLAESASGIILGSHLPDDKLPLLKSMTVHYKRRMQGGLSAKAYLNEQQIKQVIEQPKGDVVVAVEITDESGEQPVQCEMNWAWISKQPK